MLAKRLVQRGVVLSGGALAAVLSQEVASAGVPSSVVACTLKAADLLAAGAISARVAALTAGMMKAMLFTRLKSALAVVQLLGFVAAGASVLICRSAAVQGYKRPPAEKPVGPAAKPKAELAWGKEAGGLQAGLGFRPGEKRAYHHGEPVTLVIRVRNVGKKTVTFQYVRQFLDENPPTVTNAAGRAVPQPRTDVLGFHLPVAVVLKPGQETELESRLAGGARRAGASGLRYEFRPAGGRGNARTRDLPLFVGTGKASLRFDRALGSSSSGRLEIDPRLSKLATGTLEIEIKADPPAE